MAGIISNNIVTDGLVFYLDAANTKSIISGNTNWNDLSQNNRNSTLFNGATFDSNNLGSIAFDGINDYVRTDNSFALPSTVTYSFWVKSNISADAQTLLGDNGQGGVPAGYVWIYRDTSSNNIVFQYSNGSIAALVSNNGMWTNFNNVWINIVVAVDYSLKQITWYRNGQLRSGPNALAGTPPPPSNYFKYIGSYRPNLHFLSGNMANVQIHNRVLSETEILQNYNALKSRYQ